MAIDSPPSNDNAASRNAIASAHAAPPSPRSPQSSSPSVRLSLFPSSPRRAKRDKRPLCSPPRGETSILSSPPRNRPATLTLSPEDLFTTTFPTHDEGTVPSNANDDSTIVQSNCSPDNTDPTAIHPTPAVPTMKHKKIQKAKPKTPTSTDPIIPASSLFGTWIRPSTFVESPPTVLPGDHSKFLTYARRQVAHCFDERRASKNMDKFNGPTYSTRSSSIDDDLFLDTDAASLNTTDQRRLSRLLIEDLVSTLQGTKLLLLVNTASKVFDADMAKTIMFNQNNETTRLSGNDYYRLQCVVSNDNLHRKLIGGLKNPSGRGIYNLNEFMRDYKCSNGFSIKFDGESDDFTVPLVWSDVVNHPLDIMFFGPPRYGTRQFDHIFRKRTSKDYIHHIFKCFFNELVGDMVASLALINSYLNALLQLEIEGHRKTKLKVLDIPDSFKNKDWNKFFEEWDEVCRNSLQRVFSRWNDYSQPIIPTSEFIPFLDRAPTVFGSLWNVLASLRGIKPNQKKEDDRTSYKQRQLLFQVMTMARIGNPKRMKHWALIQSIANFGWGVGRTAADAFCYFGATVSTSTRYRMLNDLTKDLLAAQKALLRPCTAVVFVYDNFQKGQQLKFQRGAHSSSFLKGTHEIVHRAHLWIDTSYNDKFVPLTHSPNQEYPSPYHMFPYETITKKHYGHYLAFDQDTSPEEVLRTKPDFTGKRVDAYIELRDTACWVNKIHQFFGKRERDLDFYDQCPATIDKNKLLQFNNKCRTRKAKKLFAGAKSFQKNAVRQWNPYVDEVTHSCLLGVLGIDESDSNGCGAVLLDFLFRAGVMYQNEEDASWEVADDYHTRRMYVFGDAKTIENENKFIRDFQGRRLSYDKANVQAENFLKATTVVMELPGDWHSGMNMLQSLFNIYYDGFLESFQKTLGWKRINSDVRGCYYQASRLVSFVSDELIRFLLEQYICNKHNFRGGDVDKMEDNPNALCHVATGFHTFIQELQVSDDEWLSTCANFIIMSTDFLQFVEAYRNADAVAIEHGYWRHLPVWEALGQDKYVEITLQQQENLLRNFVYQRLQESRLNRCVRRFHGSTGKSSTAHDENLEHFNRFYSMFPIPRTCARFVKDGNYVGIALMCKNFVMKWYHAIVTNKNDEKKDKDGYNTSVESSMIPEQKLLYEMLRLLKTDTFVSDRKMHSHTIHSITKDLTIKIERKKLENAMNVVPVTAADGILSIIEDVNRTSVNPVPEENDDDAVDVSIDDAIPIDEDELMMEERNKTDDRTDWRKKNIKVATRKTHKYLSTDVWSVGWKILSKKNILKRREARDDRLKRKQLVQKALVEGILQMKSDASYGCVKRDKRGLPMWRQIVNSRIRTTT